MQPLISLENVDVALDGQTVLRAISWRLMPGEHWAILGGNGAGKSTLLKLIRGELWPAPGRGRRVYALDGVEQTTAVGVKERIALVSPELQSRYLQQEWKLTALQAIHSGFQGGDYAYEKPAAEQRQRAIDVARRLGADHLLRRNVQELSTGELRRVLIARAMVGRPRVLVCDEICDGLDAASRAGLLNLLEEVATGGTQILCATHRDEELIPSIGHRLVLAAGQVVEGGRRVPKDQGQRRARGRSQGAQLRTPTASSPRVPERSTPGGEGGPPIIQIEKASVYLGNKPVLRNIHWRICRGEHWAVIGGNGAGKTTLLKLVLGDLHPAWGGTVRRFEFTPRNTIWQVKRRIGHVSPELQSNYRESWTGAEVIGSGFFASVGLTRRLSGVQKQRVSGIIATLRLEALAEKNILQMSYGEFRKILLARALVHQPELLICDEPFDGLDASARREMAATLGLVAEGGTNLLMVTHHSKDLPDCITRIAELEAGRMLFQGTAAEFQNRTQPGTLRDADRNSPR